MKLIIDLSQFNTINSFEKIKNNCHGIIFRVGYRGYGKSGTLVKDSSFDKNIKEAISINIPIGVYFVTQAISEKEAQAEAGYVHSLIKDYKLDLGVYVDSEYGNSKKTGRADNLSKTNRTKYALAFLNKMKELGYNKLGVYASESWFNNNLDYDKLKDYIIWVAKYSKTKPSIKYSGWQYSDKGIIAGISSRVDLSEFEDSILNNKEEVSIVSNIKVQMYKCKISDVDRIGYIPMLNGKGDTVSNAAVIATHNEKRPSVICNAELFNMNNYKPSSGVVNNGIEELLTDTLGVAFVDNKKPVLSYKNNVKAKDWLSAYPLLVRDGNVVVTKAPAGLGGSTARTALCWNDEYVAVVYVKATDKATLTDFAKKIVELGFTFGTNFDGGGSTACITPLYAYDQGRKVRGKVGIWLKSGEENILAKSKPLQEEVQKPVEKPAQTSLVQPSTQLQNENIVKSGNMYLDKRYVKGAKMKIFNCGAVNFRNAQGKVIRLINGGDKVTWYGYFTKNYIKSGTWYYVKHNGVAGYIISDYLAFC